MAQHNAFYAQSGGVTAVINASACGVIEACRQAPDQIGKVYADQGLYMESLEAYGKALQIFHASSR